MQAGRRTDLAAAAGVRVDGRGAIVVDRRMRTSLPDVWAAGDCVHTHHALLTEPTYMPLGTTAHKQGRVAGENAAGFAPVTVQTTADDHERYYPGRHRSRSGSPATAAPAGCSARNWSAHTAPRSPKGSIPWPSRSSTA